MKKLISLLCCVLLLAALIPPVEVYAAGVTVKNGTIDLTSAQLKSNPASVIESALKLAKTKATAAKPITINVPSGKYSMSKCLHIYSNTTLNCKADSYFIRDFSDNNMLKCGVQSETKSGYTGYVNMKIIGGVWDCNYNGNSCGMRFAHCKNVTLQNVTIKNNKNAHHMELAGADNFKITNCKFSGFKRFNSMDGLAIQIDVLHDSQHFPSYKKFDDTPCKNITVSGCTFDNVYAGVGTRSGVIGSYFENIKIINNKFTNIKDKAICAFNYRNSTISGNTISQCTLGIIFENFPASNLLGKLYMPNNKKASTAINGKCHCQITNNKITVNNLTNRDNASGIAIYGGRLDAKQSKSTGLKAGNYEVGYITVSNNTIVTGSNVSGLLLYYVHHSTIQKNSVTNKAAPKNGKHALYMHYSYSNAVSSNTLLHFSNGIHAINHSQGNRFYKNTIQNQDYNAMAFDATSGGVVYNNNSYKNNRSRFWVAGKKPGVVTIAAPKVTYNKKTNVNTVKWNKAAGATGYGIYKATKANGSYQRVKLVNKKTFSLNDKSIKKNQRYYYNIIPYAVYSKTTIQYPTTKAGTVK